MVDCDWNDILMGVIYNLYEVKWIKCWVYYLYIVSLNFVGVFVDIIWISF